MSRAAAIVTNRGRRTCHAAIIARELGIPTVVGSGNATSVLTDGDVVTVSCAEGHSSYVYARALDYEVQRIVLDSMPVPPLKVMMDVANPERAFAFSRIPNDGVGLARVEFLINSVIGVHPRALLALDELPDDLKSEIQSRISGYPDGRSFFVEKLKEGVDDCCNVLPQTGKCQALGFQVERVCASRCSNLRKKTQ